MPFVVSVNAKVPIKSMAELIAYAKANPGKLNFGSAGVGSAPHMGIALISVAAGIDMVHVPFAGLGPDDQRADRRHGGPGAGHAAADQAACRVRRGPRRRGDGQDPPLRCCPTCRALQEAGLNVTTIVSYGLSAPAGTPEPILARLRKVMTEMIEDKAVVERLRVLGYESDHLIGDAYRDFIVKDLEQWRGVAKAANIKIEN